MAKNAMNLALMARRDKLKLTISAVLVIYKLQCGLPN